MQHKSLVQKLKHPEHVVAAICRKLYFLFPGDCFYLKLIYYLEMGKKLRLKNPKAFSEKLQWLKLYDRNPEYTKMVDKISVKRYVASMIGEKYIIPTLGVWDKVENIEWKTLPDKFVIKASNGGGGGGVFVCKDKSVLDIKSVSQKLNFALKSNIYQQYREWPYKNVKPRIIAEECLECESEMGLKDYKVFCCNGEPKLIKVNYDVETDYKSNWYTPLWEYMKGTTINDPSHEEIQIEKPQLLDELLDRARVLSKNIPFVRVDFYILPEGLKFGELTFYPGSGFEKFDPESFDEEIGSWIDLSKI